MSEVDHSYRPEDAPYKDPEWLRREYWAKGRSLHDIGDECDVTAASVQYQMDKHDIPTRVSNKAKTPVFYTDQDGYERVSSCSLEIGIHQLVAIAEYGIEAVAGKEVHHHNHIPWDNRPENVEPMTKSQHTSWHNTET